MPQLSSYLAPSYLFLCTIALSAAAQQQSPSPPIVIHATTNLVQLDVVVSEKDNPVRHLDKQRFHLTEDGKEQTIVAFDEHPSDDAASVPAMPSLPPNTFSNRPRYPAGGSVNILLLDGLNTPIADQARARAQMLDLLTKIPPGTQIALFTLASRLRLVQGFTTDPAALVKALKSSASGPQQSVLLDNGQSSISGQLSDVGATDSAVASMQQFEADITAFQTDLRVGITIQAMQQLARYLNGIPGRKNLLWLSGSFPVTLNADSALSNPFTAVRNYADEIRDASTLLASARVAVYPVDARGLLSLPSFQASYTSNSRASARNPSPGFAQDNSKFFAQNEAEHASMDQLAIDTGGKAFFNNNDLKAAVSQAIQSGSSYYTLSFTPSVDKLDGHLHKLKVRIDGSNYHLTYRPAYFAGDPGKPATRLPGASIMQQATLRGAPQSTQLLFETTLTPVPATGAPAGEMAASLKAPLTRYHLDLRLHPDTLYLSADDDGSRHGQVELVAIAYDRDDKRINYIAYNLPVNLRAQQYALISQSNLPIRAQIDLPTGLNFLRIVLRDLQTQKIGSLEIPLTVPTN